MFLSPAVAGIMQAGFVESRHHTDSQNTLTEQQLEENQRLQMLWAESTANPFFVVVDPRTGQKLGVHELSGGPGVWEGEWIAFLNRMLAAAGRN